MRDITTIRERCHGICDEAITQLEEADTVITTITAERDRLRAERNAVLSIETAEALGIVGDNHLTITEAAKALRAENAALFLQLNEQLERADSLAHSVIELENKLVAQSASLLALQQAVAVYREALEYCKWHATRSNQLTGIEEETVFAWILEKADAALSLSPDSTLMGRVVQVLKDAEQDYLFPGTIDQLPIVTNITKILEELGADR